MQLLFHQQMNIVSAIVLLLFLMYASSVLDRKSNINKMYFASLYLNLVLIAIDLTFNFIIKINNISAFFPRVIAGLIFVLAPILPYLFMRFVCVYFTTPYKIKKLTNSFFIVLITLNSVVAIFSFKSKSSFVSSLSI